MNYKISYLNNLKYLQKNVINNLSLKNYKIKFKISDMKYTLNLIYKYING